MCIAGRGTRDRHVSVDITTMEYKAVEVAGALSYVYAGGDEFVGGMCCVFWHLSLDAAKLTWTYPNKPLCPCPSHILIFNFLLVGRGWRER